MSVSLYRRFRPDTFQKVIGQEHIIKTLTNQIASGRISHAYLFTGTRGTGKTSTAKIFAKAVNCLAPNNGSPCGKCEVCKALAQPNNLDIIEIDAASNNGVDEIRELRENVQYRPSIGKYKVYIIDEVHMLTPAAFNALLKTLEEPPEHIIFILATTEVHKLPQTILSRCQRFDFRLVSDKVLEKHLKSIFDEIGQKTDDRALTLIARHGEGSVRDAISIADMLVSYSTGVLTGEDVEEALGLSSFDMLTEIADAIVSADITKLLTIVQKAVEDGKNITNLAKDLVEYFLRLVGVKKLARTEIPLTDAEYAVAGSVADKSDEVRLVKIIGVLSGLESELRYTTQPQIIFSALLIEAASAQTDVSLENTLSRLRIVEKRLNDLYLGGVNVAIATKTTPKEELSEENKSSLAALKENSERAEPSETPEDGEAASCWAMTGELLRANGELALSGVVATTKSVVMEDGVLVLVTNQPGVISLLSDERYVNRINKAVVSCGAKGFAVRDSREKSNLRSENDGKKLAELFGVNLNK